MHALHRPVIVCLCLWLAASPLHAGKLYTKAAETVVVAADEAPVMLGGTRIATVGKGRWFGVRKREPGRVGMQLFSGRTLRIGWLAEEHVRVLRDGDIDLTAEALAVGKAYTPGLDVAACRAQIDALAGRVAAAARKGRSPIHRALLIRRQLFGREGFRYDPAPRTLDRVVADQRGNCLGLSILYLCAAQKLDLPLQMLAVPGHVLLRYDDPEKPFNIEPAMMGMVLRGDACVRQRLGPLSGIYPRVLSDTQAVSVLLGDAGAVMAEEGRTDDAIAAFVRAVEINPDQAEAYHNWGITLSRTNKLAAACDKFARAVRLYPRFTKAHVAWGCVVAKLGDFDSACRKFARASELNPRDGSALFNWGSVLLATGKRAEALEKLRRAVALRPSLEPMVRTLTRQANGTIRIQLVE